ncbi:hypothetical protein TrST_g5675 [Triparma strigata]|uniref:Uncharacterized protein n=1 Tax=Triparma strigata TaxID=1606541 RepID=A0A9W7DTP6_9STRA|nr:hypothetical protein TrST_g5675 [Triparma strigata]
MKLLTLYIYILGNIPLSTPFLLPGSIKHSPCLPSQCSRLKAGVKNDAFYGGGPPPFGKSEIDLVVSKTLCSPSSAVRALSSCDGNVLESILLLNSESRQKLEAMNGIPEGGVDWDGEMKAFKGGGGEGPRPIGNDGNEERDSKKKARQDAEKLKKQMDKWKLEGEDADWFPGFSAKDQPDSDEPWFTG